MRLSAFCSGLNALIKGVIFMVTLSNGKLTVEISEKGAEMKRITLDGKERLWNGDPAYWTGTAPVLFPVCGGLPDDKFTYGGKEYTLKKHGFARHMMFEVEKVSGISAVFLLKSSEETLKMYPWDFELRVSYTLRGTAVKIEYEVKNLSDGTMYASLGAHEAYACPDGIENYDVIFEKKETLDACELDGNLISEKTRRIITDTDTLPLYTEFFAVDALVFKSLKSRFATLRNRVTGESVSVEFGGFDYFLIWTKPGAGYICLEPWAGIPPMKGAGNSIEEKEGINKVPAGEKLSLTHTIYF